MLEGNSDATPPPSVSYRREFSKHRTRITVAAVVFLSPRGALAGTLPEQVEISENGRRFLVDIRHGQKTGFYMDQRDNSTLFGALAHGRRVLNPFAFTGGCWTAAVLGGWREVGSVAASA